MAKAAAGGGGADSSVADELRRLGVRGVLVQMAERGQLLASDNGAPVSEAVSGSDLSKNSRFASVRWRAFYSPQVRDAAVLPPQGARRVRFAARRD